MKMRDPSGTSFDASAASNAFFVVNQNRTCFLTYRQGAYRARLDTRVVFALHAEMRNFSAWNKHKHANARCLRPNTLLMMK